MGKSREPIVASYDNPEYVELVMAGLSVMNQFEGERYEVTNEGRLYIYDAKGDCFVFEAFGG